ncbi:hypothetical protein [Antrihabitans spumae]|jgi:hypothetical protein|uniref:UrcA family protein n=1 Tax=Antrihabitans spumae TaxID=3373370 RepID=A0ABW7JTT6_9NOCA
MARRTASAAIFLGFAIAVAPALVPIASAAAAPSVGIQQSPQGPNGPAKGPDRPLGPDALRYRFVSANDNPACIEIAAEANRLLSQGLASAAADVARSKGDDCPTVTVRG